MKTRKKFKLNKNKPFYSPRFDSLGSYTGNNSSGGYKPEQDADDL